MRKVHLLTADLPVGSFPKDIAQSSRLVPNDDPARDLPVGTALIGQIPHWLNVAQSALAEPPLQIIHHSSIFNPPQLNNSDNYLASSLPTFNSLAIEARMASVPDLREYVLYMNVSEESASQEDDDSPPFYRTTCSCRGSFPPPTSRRP